MPFEITQPATDDEFKQYFQLRWRILRAPWKQPQGSEIDNMEKQCVHVMAIETDSSNQAHPVIGVARLQYNSETEAQIRYMAVAPEHEKKGIGRALIKTLEKHTRNNTCKTIVLDAREPAVGFYEKQGYRITNKSYLLFDEIQHYRMVKAVKTNN